MADGFRTRPQRHRLRASRASSAASTSSIRSRMSRSVRTDTCSSGSISSSGSNSSRLMRGDRSGRVRHVSRVELTSLGAVGDHVGGCSAFDKQRGGIGVTVAVAERVPVHAASAGGVDQRTWAPGPPPRGRRARGRWTAAAAQQPRPRLPVQVTKMSDAADRADNDPLQNVFAAAGEERVRYDAFLAALRESLPSSPRPPCSITQAAPVERRTWGVRRVTQADDGHRGSELGAPGASPMDGHVRPRRTDDEWAPQLPGRRGLPSSAACGHPARPARPALRAGCAGP